MTVVAKHLEGSSLSNLGASALSHMQAAESPARCFCDCDAGLDDAALYGWGGADAADDGGQGGREAQGRERAVHTS